MNFSLYSKKEESRVVLLALNEGEIVAKCLAAKVAISAIEQLPGGGVRLVCRTTEGANLLARRLRPHVMDSAADRTPHRPTACG